jgi:hypothetical protein
MPRIKTEQAWLQSTTPHSLLLTLKGKRLPRQRRLFAVACCRHWLHEMLDPESRIAVEVAERYVDGLASRDELEAAYRAAQEAAARRLAPCQVETERDLSQEWSTWRLAHIAQIACAPSGTQDVVSELLKRANRLSDEHEDQERRWLSDCIRDIFGNPFRSPPSVPSAWLSWNNRTIPKLTQALYDERNLPTGSLDNARLVVLADALEEAGCSDAVLLDHCRQPAEHVRGCWVVDLLLGKA